jgi:MFS transporter, UMF1 family
MPALYDLMLLLDPNAPDERRAEVIAEVHSMIESGGEAVGSHDWGVRRLAFEIDHRPEAAYHLFQFEGEPALLERLGLHRRELRAWAMYEWATTGMWAVIVATVFPIYYQTVAAADVPGPIAVRNFAYATTLGIVLVAVVAPLLGAITDRAAIKKPLLAAFAALGISAAGLLFFVERGDWFIGLVFFVLVNIGVNGSTVFYDALLPHIARRHEVDRVSTGAFAIGYLGAGLLLTFCLVMIQRPDLFGIPEGTLPARLSFVAVAVWWAAFSLPLFLRVREPPAEIAPGDVLERSTFQFAVKRIQRTFRELRAYRYAFLLLIAYLVYGDGIGTIIRMATIYGAELGIAQGHMIGAVVMVQFVGVPFSFLFGMLAGRIGTKRAIFLGLLVYVLITILGYFMTSALHFWMLAFMVGTVQGGTQALSRSLYASMIPAYKSGELFGFYGVMDKFAGMIGPTVLGLVAATTGSTRLGILSILVFFIVGAAILFMVDEQEGRRIAQEAQARARPLDGVEAAGSD